MQLVDDDEGAGLRLLSESPDAGAASSLAQGIAVALSSTELRELASSAPGEGFRLRAPLEDHADDGTAGQPHAAGWETVVRREEPLRRVELLDEASGRVVYITRSGAIDVRGVRDPDQGILDRILNLLTRLFAAP